MNNEHRFSYSARELRTPLRKLIDFLKAYIVKHESAAIEARGVSVRRGALGTASDAEVHAAKIVKAQEAAHYDLARAELWLHECVRLPWYKRISLDELELRWLYRYRS